MTRMSLDALPMPDGVTSAAALEVATAHHSPALLNHSLRAYVWAAARGAADGIAFDPELLYVAALFHDIGLVPTFDSHTVAFEQAGYEHRGERGVPGREFFRKGEPRAFHLHLVEQDGPLWNDYLDFRDYLRAHADDARQLASVKRLLAARFARDREAYVQAKAVHVQRILQLAHAARGKQPSDHDH